jgi:hypothetical protein
MRFPTHFTVNSTQRVIRHSFKLPYLSSRKFYCKYVNKTLRKHDISSHVLLNIDFLFLSTKVRLSLKRMQESRSILYKTYRPAQHRLYTNINMYSAFYTYFTCNLNDIKRSFTIKLMVSCNLGESKIFRKTFV